MAAQSESSLVSQSTVGSRSVVAYAVAIFVRSTRPASKSNLSVVEACPWVVHHHADYSTTQRECFVQKNTGKASLRLRVELYHADTSPEHALSISGCVFTSSLIFFCRNATNTSSTRMGWNLPSRSFQTQSFRSMEVRKIVYVWWTQWICSPGHLHHKCGLSIFVLSDVSFLWKHL